MNIGTQIRQVLPFNNRKELLVRDEDQDTPEIIIQLKKRHRLDKKQYDEISDLFWKGNAKNTAAFIFDTLKKNVVYDVEPEHTQTVKTPGAIINQGYGDCKHYALFATGICDSLNRKGFPIAAKYRFVADHPGSEVHHVFSVISGKDGEYWCDPVLKVFNDRPKFHNIKDADMAIYQISGTDRGAEVAQVAGTDRGVQVAQVGLSFKKNPFKQFKHSMEVNLHNVQHGLAVDAANAKTAILKIGALPARKAFLSLVALNVRSLATNLARNRNTPKWNKLMSIWHGLGGDPKTLDQAIHNGQNRKRLGYIGILGVDDAAIATWTALASAVLLALKQFIHVSPETEKAEAKSAAEGTAHLLGNAYKTVAAVSDMADAGDDTPAAAAALDKLTNNTNTTGAMSITPGVTADGSPSLTVHDIDHPAISLATKTDEDISNVAPRPADTNNDAPPTDTSNFMDTFKADLQTFWANYIMPVILVAGGLITYKIATAPPRKRRR